MTVTDAELDAACQSFWEPGLYKFRDTMRRALEAAAAARPSEEMVDFLKSQQDGLLEANGALIKQLNSLAASHAKLLSLVRTMFDNDPNEDAADGVTVLDVWRKEARDAIAAAEGDKQ